MTAYLLDTSALVCHFFEERGWQRVHEILMGEDELFIAAPSVLELCVAIGAAGGRPPEAVAADYLETSAVVDVTAAVARRAWQLRSAAAKRVPAIDCLIAACAVEADATLVHRDPHFAAISSHHLKQVALDAK